LSNGKGGGFERISLNRKGVTDSEQVLPHAAGIRKHVHSRPGNVLRRHFMLDQFGHNAAAGD
jgi:hypothetical protein